jgi:MoxR-like ATPase
MLDELRNVCATIKSEVSRIVVGQEENIDFLLVALLSEGHVLLEGVPGTGKTLLARAFSSALNLDFNRIQFTPDLMPGDVIGTNLFNFHHNEFTLTKGPIFTQICLADEINRTPPKTQAALLQAMQERTVSIDGTTHQLDPAFMVVATQNPLEHEGTYPLPEAQLDRFLLKLTVGYPDKAQERAMVLLHGHRSSMPKIEEFKLVAATDSAGLKRMRDVVSEIRLSDEIVDYIVELIRATRGYSALLAGASPRSANMLATASRARAAIQGRDFVIPDDVKGLVKPVLGHRILLGPAAELDGTSAEVILDDMIKTISAPR